MKTTRILAAALSICMLGGAVGYDAPLFEGASVTADAAKQKYENVSGTCGESLTWTIDRNTGVLTVEGTGKMTSAPWSIYYDTPYTEEIRRVVLPEGLINVYYSAFSECSNLTEINIPESVTSIEGMAFRKCSSLTEINIPDSVNFIGYSAFESCSGLTDIHIPEGITSISSSTFYECSSLTEINIPEGVTSIGNNAFYKCSSLTSITIPSTCEEIGAMALSVCPNLESVTILNPDVYFVPFTYRQSEVSDPSPLYYTNVHWDISENEIETWRDQSWGGGGVNNDPVFSGTVYGYPDSTAEEFAKDYCNFEVLSFERPVSISFDASGADGTMVRRSVESGSEFILPGSRFNPPSGKTFAGWKIGDEIYAPGDRLTVDSPLTIYAVWEDDIVCGEDMTWSFDEETGTLTITGTGEMTSTPWTYNYEDKIRKVIISEGVTKSLPFSEVYYNALTDEYRYAYENLTEIIYPSTCADIGKDPLEGCVSLKSVTIKNPDVILDSWYADEKNGSVKWAVSNNEPMFHFADDGNTRVLENEPEFTGTIYGYSGSTAEAFAEDYCKFEVIDQKPTKGDLNNDTMIDGRDATLVLAMYADSSSSGYVPTDEDRAAGDVNNDTFIDGRDATIILAYYADISSGISIGFEDYLKLMNYV